MGKARSCLAAPNVFLNLQHCYSGFLTNLKLSPFSCQWYFVSMAKKIPISVGSELGPYSEGMKKKCKKVKSISVTPNRCDKSGES